jgi:hypothetical protein
MTHEGDGDGRHRDQAVREEKRYARSGQPAAATAEEQSVEGPNSRSHGTAQNVVATPAPWWWT